MCALLGRVAPWAAARPRAAHAACCCLWRRWCSGRRRARPPARSPHTSFARSGRSRSPPVPSGPSGALHTGGAGSLMCALRVDSLSGQAPLPPIDFARNSPAACSNIEFASLELQCFGVSRKMSTINYVRNLGGGGVVAARGYRSLASPLPVGITGVSRVEFLGWSGVCCYKRRQSKVFFVWISVPLLQTSSI